jgi:phosphatidylserine/phosphatidylglycerophosphate/cardiolipin synthase-like enzyme
MRVQKSADGLTAMATAGGFVVLIGWNMAEADMRARGVLGFSIRRKRHDDGEICWLGGMKTFESVEPNPPPGALVNSFFHPLQTFQWADYSVEPEKTYTYRVVARTGAPDALVEDAAVDLKVTTESIDQGTHAVFFNRGSIASQEYARRFQNRPPDEVGQPAFDWLSRGLIESLLTYIEQAGDGDELLGAFFEFKNTDIFERLKQAKARGAKVKILYDGDSQRAGNEAALEGSGIKSLTKARERSGQFAHNKFLILRQGDVSRQVWTGSTNLSQNGIYGHSNNAHLVRDQAIAEKYFEYWQTLLEDDTRKPTATANMATSPVPPPSPNGEITPVFSPRLDLDALDWYAEMAGNAERALLTTFAFGMDQRFVDVYDQRDGVLRFALMEKKGNGTKFKEQAAQIDKLRRQPNVTVSIGHKVELNNFDRWLEEIDRVTAEAHVLYVHTKYMLIDPLGDDPIVIVGSANFSVASTDKNDENMLVIRGNKEVADIYLGEFMRLFTHYAFRESLRFKDNQSEAAALTRKHLVEDVSWIDGNKPSASYFRAGTDRTLRRVYFSGG